MSVLISGVLIDPSGTAISGAEITFTALTNGNSVLNGFSVSATTNDQGEYAIPLELCDYSISIQHDGNNAIYGSVSINKDTTPTTINDLLEKARQEQTVTPQIIVYFREIQADVTQKLGTMQSLNTEAKSAADSATTSNEHAQEQAQKAQQASELSQQASASALTSANAASASKAAAETASTNALNSANAASAAKGAAESAANQAEQSKLSAVSAAGSAESAKTAAGTSATQAANSANNASASATSASTSSQAASQAASSASNSASSAAGSASAAQQSAVQAEVWAKTVDTSNFARKGANGDITSLSGLTTALSVAQGGTGATTAAAARMALGLGAVAIMNTGATSGTVAAGDDKRLNTIDGKSGGTISGKILSNTTDWALERPASSMFQVSGESYNAVWLAHGHQHIDAIVYGQYFSDSAGSTGYRLVHSRSDFGAKVWFFRHDGAAVGLNWISTSDGRLKDNKEEIDNALDKVHSLTGMLYDIQGNRRAGLIAQDVEKVLPAAVVNTGAATASNGATIENSLALDYNAVTALLVNAVKEQQGTIELQQRTIEALFVRVDALESRQN
ncbi:prophage tail fiber N-terminal domain-containing protein [Dickeya oryzae]|uniref:tail fiber domain-containing protein n=1 Tax=Dickeya oryzae TaxID=1240404 RepID=UPI001AEC7497|nr:tail fiber domain-containing protein [Dickeya oryzae]MBP2845434.1 prophage tail fiber N-terminal domain-containing protein [Dickeya oryzae]